jgi:hypothetical protein
MSRSIIGALALALAFGVSSRSVAQDVQEDPIFEISIEMHSVVGKLAKQATDKPTQENQQEVVSKLDTLIAKLEEEAKKNGGSGNSSGANPNKPLNESKIIGGPGGSGKLHASRDDGKSWGELPPHERDRILQSLTEGFPAHYQKILERYYKRLADEKSLAELDEEAVGSGAAASKKAAPKKPAPASTTNKTTKADK